MAANLFTEEVIELVRRAAFDPAAKRAYDMMSDSFWWSDEMMLEMASICLAKDNWAFRSLLAYRGTLIRGQPDDRLRPAWDQLLQACPHWPGFRRERYDAELLPALQRAGRRALISCERLDREYRRRQSEECESEDRDR
jgi:hypothetical protein